jgi:hypothetical protein
MDLLGQIDVNLSSPDARSSNSLHDIWYICTER